MKALAALAVALCLPASAVAALPGSFRILDSGPAGGAVWQGVIPGPTTRPSAVYLPPGFSPDKRYPVVYLLHGMPGSPYSYVVSLRLAEVADGLIAQGAVRPFIAVVPAAGPSGRYEGEWTGVWEDEVVQDVVPWVDAHLPTEATPGGRTLAGLSSGAFGAVDIGLRHLGLFGTIESWGGYFRPFRDGTLAAAGPAELAAHDPTLLVRREAPTVRALRLRFWLSTGPTHSSVLERWTSDFARELASLHIPYKLRLFRHDPWREQFAAGLRYALRR